MGEIMYREIRIEQLNNKIAYTYTLILRSGSLPVEYYVDSACEGLGGWFSLSSIPFRFVAVLTLWLMS
jgi:hypothetical protein